MNFNFLVILYLLTLTVGCSDYKLSKVTEYAPEILVDPLDYDCGNLFAGSEYQEIVVSVRNIGNDTLDIESIFLNSGGSNFTIVSTYPAELEPTESFDLILKYEPKTYESNSDILSILSNDIESPIVNVSLLGKGDAPVIQVTPEYYDFGDVYLGCEDQLNLNVSNVGNIDLEIFDIEYFASLPADFSIEEYEDLLGPLPIIIPPADSIEININYLPVDLLDDSSYLEIQSNDPANPATYADQDATGAYEKEIVDTFTQEGTVDVDILFVIDNSGSMNSNQANLKNNFDAFMSAFNAAGVSYQIALITTDDSNFVGSVITNLTTDPISEFNNQVDSIGTSGSAHEKGLWYAYESTTIGDASPGSATGFFRSSARLVVVYVSDEPDWSHQTTTGGGSTSLTHSDYSSSLLSLKLSSSLVVAHAIAGDYPSGCSSNGGAQFGDGYYEVVNDLSGTFMSICASDWSSTMDTLARDSIISTSFALTEKAVENSIIVTVDGVTTSDWYYESSSNSVIFNVAPLEGSNITISYGVFSCQ